MLEAEVFESVKFTRGTGNVFADLGCPDPEGMKAKALLMIEIEKRIKKQGLSHAAAASIVSLSETQLTAVLRGHFREVSADLLNDALNSLKQMPIGSKRNRQRQRLIEAPKKG